MTTEAERNSLWLQKRTRLLPAVLLVLILGLPSISMAATYPAGNVSGVWDDSEVHYVTGDVTVPSGATLTILPGARVEFNSATELKVESGGILIAAGEDGNKITLTSAQSPAAAGDWDRLWFDSGASTSSVLEHVQILYAGGGGNGALTLEASVNVSNVTVLDSASHGIMVARNLSITDSLIQRSGGHGVYAYWGWATITVTLQDNTIEESRVFGVYSSGEVVNFSGNTIRNNRWPISVPWDSVPVPDPLDGNVFGPNTFNEIILNGYRITGNRTLGILSEGEPYEINTYVTTFRGSISVVSGATLTIKPGVVIKFAPFIYVSTYVSVGMNVQGVLHAVGTDAKPIVFTSYFDDAFGGDSNHNGYSSAPQAGDWGGITLYTAGSELEHVMIRYGGDEGIDVRADATIRNSEVAFSSGVGIDVDSSADVEISNTRVYGNGLEGVYFGGSGTKSLSESEVFANRYLGVLFEGVNGSVSDAELFANGSSAVNATGGSNVTATGIWWGDPSGPAGHDCVTDLTGTGDSLDCDGSTVTYSSVSTGPRMSFTQLGTDPLEHRGELLAPTVVSTTSEIDDIGDPRAWVHYDSQRLQLEYPASFIDSSANNYQLFVSYPTGLDLSFSAPRVRLTAGVETEREIHGSLFLNDNAISLPDDRGRMFGYWLPQDVIDDAVSSGTLRLNFTNAGSNVADVVAVNRVILIERPNGSAPLSGITSPAVSEAVEGRTFLVTGTAFDGDSSRVAGVEFGVRDPDENDGEIVWFPVHNLASNGGWSYQWALPSTGSDYEIYSRAWDDAGNVESTSAGQLVSVTQTSSLITSHPIAPAVNVVTGTSITLSGTCERNGARIRVWVRRESNDAKYGNNHRVSCNSGSWSASVYAHNLAQGLNRIAVQEYEPNFNEKVIISHATVLVWLDSLAPVVDVTPADGTATNVAPDAVVVLVKEWGSGINSTPGVTTYSITQDGSTVSGDWVVTDNALTFTRPGSIPFADGSYDISVHVEDNVGHVRNYAGNFILDRVDPVAPVLIDVPTHVSTSPIVIDGEKEADTAIWLNGVELVPLDSSETWSDSVDLIDEEDNLLNFTAVDVAGNVSSIASTTIRYDNTPPEQVSFNGNGALDGMTAYLEWDGYPDPPDLARYEVYRSSSSFSSVNGMTEVAIVDAGADKEFTDTELTRGDTVHYAVVAVDTGESKNEDVTSLGVLLTDVVDPQDITGLQVSNTSAEGTLGFSWVASVAGDLDHYNVYFDGSSTPVMPSSGDLGTSHTRTDLAASEDYSITVKAVDRDGNESTGVSSTGITWLDPVSGLDATPEPEKVSLSWNEVTPPSGSVTYRVYRSDASFSNITVGGVVGAVVTTIGTTATVAGLTNGDEYYFAVTAAVDDLGGERTNVTSVSATPVADTTPPVLSIPQFDGSALPVTPVATITDSGSLQVTVIDADSQVSRVEFFFDGASIGSDFVGVSDVYQKNVDLSDIDTNRTDVPVQFVAYDIYDNSDTLDRTVNITFAAPDAPVIASPANGSSTNEDSIRVDGTAEAGSVVGLFVGGASQGTVTANGSGSFNSTVTLVEGPNDITAKATKRGNTSVASDPPVTVDLDLDIPPAPTGVVAAPRAGGEIALSWISEPGMSLTYDVYRSEVPFSDKTGMTPANLSPIEGTSFDDLPPADGTYYYRVVAVKGLTSGSVESPLSNEVNAISDATAPEANITFSGIGGNQYGSVFTAGFVEVTITASEVLSARPYVSLTPEGGIPIILDPVQQDDLTYTDTIQLMDTTKSGTATILFSGRDRVGNRGTEITPANSIEIDTDGPKIVELYVSPQDPIENTGTVGSELPILVSFALDEAPAAGEDPDLFFVIDYDELNKTQITGLLQLDETRTTWEGTFLLPDGIGGTVADPLNQTLSFLLESVDDYGNFESEMAVDSFQVYKGDLPPLTAPTGVTVTARPNGAIELNWDAVSGAAGYVLYRQGPDHSGPDDFISNWTPLNTTTFMDSTGTDGVYDYVVTSLRVANGEEAESGFSAKVSAAADSVAPIAPENLQLSEVGQGIYAQWDWNGTPEAGLTYTLYRGVGSSLAPLTGGIPAAEAIDANPSTTDHDYAVAAVDAAGNVSDLSPSVYINPSLLPINTLSVVKDGDASPVVSWTHPSAGFEYRLELIDGTDRRLLVDETTATNFTDAGYDGFERHYEITAYDDSVGPPPEESAARAITLPVLTAELAADSEIRRGVFTELTYTVTNTGAEDATGVKLKATVGGADHYSTSYQVLAGESVEIPIVVGGYDALSDLETVALAIELSPGPGESIRIQSEDTVTVAGSRIFMSVETQGALVRGSTGQVRFTLENTSDVVTEVVLADSATKASSEVDILLYDEDRNLVGMSDVKQTMDANGFVSATIAGPIVARLQPGEIFTSDWFDLSVPSQAPNYLNVVVDISKYHYGLGSLEHVEIAGGEAMVWASLIDTPYYGALEAITPEVSYGDEPIVITGYSYDSVTHAPAPNEPLLLVLRVQGFERIFSTMTGSDGSFTFTYYPTLSEAGIYKISVLHPDRLDRPEHGEFSIGAISPSVRTVNVKIPRHYVVDLGIKAIAAKGTNSQFVEVEYLEADQVGGLKPQGVDVVLPVSSLGITGGEVVGIPIDFSGDETAPRVGSFVLRMNRIDGPDTQMVGLVTVNWAFSPAIPVLLQDPTYINTGAIVDESISESITIENQGLAPASGIRALLKKPDLSGVCGADSQDLASVDRWISLTSSADIGLLDVGDASVVSFSAMPRDEGTYNFCLHVTSDNAQEVIVPIAISAVLSGTGDVFFKVADIYTGTQDPNAPPGELIEGLEGAKIRLTHLQTGDVTEGVTNPVGEVDFPGLTPGQYSWRASALDHTDQGGFLWVRPGPPTFEDIFLVNNIISIEWSVEETTIIDRYDIVLKAKFKTNVPIAVMIMEPSSISIPSMREGQVFYGEISLTNYGLIDAYNILGNFPNLAGSYQFEFMKPLPSRLAPHERVVIPYRVTAIKHAIMASSPQDIEPGEPIPEPAPSPENPDGGNDCAGITACITATGEAMCAAGESVGLKTVTCYTVESTCDGGDVAISMWDPQEPEVETDQITARVPYTIGIPFNPGSSPIATVGEEPAVCAPEDPCADADCAGALDRVIQDIIDSF